MNRYPKALIISAVALATFVTTAAADAGQQARSRGESRSGGQQAAPARPQGETRQAAPSRPQGQPQAQAAPQQRRQVGPSSPAQGPRAVAGQRAVPRPQYSVPQGGRFERFAPSRTYIAPRLSVGPRLGYGYGYGGYNGGYRYSPYYTFRPRLSIGLGFYAGYPVAFPSWYDSYAYRGYDSYAYGYGNTIRPQVASYGGVSFDINPADAEVYIDGEYVGLADDFSSTEPPLTLSLGVHHIELRAPGFRPMAFDITAIPGQVIPYQGTLSR